MFRKYGWVIAVFIVAMFAWGAFSAEQASGADANEYVGDNEKKCGMCHKEQVAAWKKWPMAKTWDTLQASKDKKDSCIPCHVTGFGKPGGFVSIEKTPKLYSLWLLVPLVGLACAAVTLLTNGGWREAVAVFVASQT